MYLGGLVVMAYQNSKYKGSRGIIQHVAILINFIIVYLWLYIKTHWVISFFFFL